MKQCSKCKQTKQLIDFTRSKITEDGCGSWCKECHRKYYFDKRSSHYNEPYDDPKTCPRCKQSKPLVEFSEFKAKGKTYIQGRCKACHREANKQRNRKYTLKAYSLTPEDFTNLLVEQNGCCDICDKPCIQLEIDHDHSCCRGDKSCGKCIRGLLCNFCNTLLSRAHDKVSILKNAIEYLERTTST